MQQYPDTILITIVTAATKDENTGVCTEGSSVGHLFDCRAEENSSGRKIPGQDGGQMEYNFDVYLPKMTTVIPENSECTITKADTSTYTGKVKRARNGQLNSRLWV